MVRAPGFVRSLSPHESRTRRKHDHAHRGPKHPGLRFVAIRKVRGTAQNRKPGMLTGTKASR